MALSSIKIKTLFSKSSQEPGKIKKNGFGEGALGFDLLYQLNYMSVIAASGAPRSQIFLKAAQTPCASSEYFKKIQSVVHELGYDYAKGCRVVGETAKEEEVKGLLLRFSSSLISGEPEAEFLERESEAQAEAYDNIYARKLETLKLWTDAYVSLILSAVLVTIIGVVSTMVWKIETLFIIGLVMVSIMTTAMGIWLIYLMTPRELTVLKNAGSIEQKLIRKLFKLAIPVSAIAAAVSLLFKGGMGYGLIAIGCIIFPIGFITVRDDRKVAKRDSEVGPFLRSLGGVCSATGTTVRDGLGRLDLNAMYHLRREVKRLYTRFQSGIRAKLCWNKFIEETGSEVANRTVGMFYDAIDLGGEPDRAGYRSSLFASKIAMLRARRKTVSSPFQWLCIAMHGAIVALLIFITQVITIFATMVAKASENMPDITGAPSVAAFSSFNISGLELLNTMVLPLVLVFTLANAVAPSIADGGSRYKILYSLGITTVISGTAMIALPLMAKSLFSSITL